MQKLKQDRARAFEHNLGWMGLLACASIIFTLNTTALAEQTKFKLKKFGTSESLKKFCVSKGFDDYSSSGKEDEYFYVVCNKHTDADIKKCIPLVENLAHEINEHLKPAFAECSRPNTAVNSLVIEGDQFDGFNNFISAFGNENTYCSHDKADTQRRSLSLMNDTLKHYYNDPQSSEETFKSEEQFKKLMSDRWEKILKHIAKKDHFYPYLYNVKDSMNLVGISLNKGVIPLPTTRDEDPSGKSLFTFTNFSKYFYLGVSPVSIASRTDLEMSNIDAHPFDSKGVVDGELNFAGHDIDHSANILAPNFKDFNISSPSSCEKFKACLDVLTAPIGEKKINPGYTKIMLFYLLHEEVSMKEFLQSQNGLDAILVRTLIENAIEMIVSKSDSKLKLNSLLGEGDSEKRNTCMNINYLQNLEKNIAETQKKLGVSRISCLRRILPEKIKACEEFNKMNRHLDENIKFLVNVADSEEPTTLTYQYRKEINFTKIIDKLEIKCHAIFPNLKEENSEPLFAANFDKFKNQGLMNEMNKELVKMTNALNRIHQEFKKHDSACHAVKF